MSDFDDAVKFILDQEGGFQDHPDDPGNYRPDGTLVGTKYGVSARSYPDVDIQNLTRDEAIEIYRADYWQPTIELVGEDAPFATKMIVLDTAINMGLGRAREFWHESNGSFREFFVRRILHYASLDTFDTFGKGWIRRVVDVWAYTADRAPETELQNVYWNVGPLKLRVPFGRVERDGTDLHLRM